MILLGIVGAAGADWRPLRPWEFLCVFGVAVFASGMKVRLPGIFGTLSVNFLFILLGITDLTGGEAIAIGCASALIQCLWNARKRVKLVQAGFSTMNVAVAVVAAFAFYHFPLVQRLNHGTPLSLMAASLLYFGINTAGVSGVIALTENKSLTATWRECYFWSFPFYLLAASLLWIVRSVDVRTQWLNELVLFPVIYVIYYSYRMYMDNLEAGKKQIELANALQQRTIEALEVAREANVLKTRFLASVSHELRTPLNGIVGFAELLYDGVVGPVNEVQRECLGDMLSCSNQLRLLIGQVLDLAKVESGKMTFNYETVSLTPLIGEVIDTLQTIAKSKQIEVVFQPDLEVDSVTADTGRLKQILYNYLSNALKFTPQAGRIDVIVSAETEDHYRIAVKDTGIGIAAEDIPRLFSEFGQLGRSETTKTGSGLGLAISKNLAEAQGGSVGVTSEINRGSTFFVILPRYPGAANSEPTLPPVNEPGEPCPPTLRLKAQPTVLVSPAPKR
ncbi:MAG TPA: HAMP domain-containing sensor histidine kinase [Bryobacteraceae bacterium]|nr:HAMP domain-containing sensor histidine kinase [Bryobacteraceae bacterium]